jgi:alginate O-acetyltransferase complex protein AlgI
MPLVVDYAAGLYIYYVKSKEQKRNILWTVVAANLALLGYYKYFGFFNENLHMIPFLRLDLTSYAAAATLVPLGISFITFQRISYIVDIYKGKIKPERNFFHYATYASLFPHLISGPIVRYSNIRDSLASRTVHLVDIFEGTKFFIIGFFLKVGVADKLFLIEDYLVKNVDALRFVDSFILIFIFSLRIYIDFVGYSLVAIGLARFMGFIFPDNFLSPYQAKSVTEFWRKWNITLSNWLRDYLYIPLGGNRKSKVRTYFNLMITMILGGLWHGASWNFMLWGLLHGLYLAIERYCNAKNISLPVPDYLKKILVFVLISFTWLTFLFQKPEQIGMVFRPIYLLTFGPMTDQLSRLLFENSTAIILAIIWAFIIKEDYLKKIQPHWLWSLIFTVLFLITLGISFISESVPFIYFQF